MIFCYCLLFHHKLHVSTRQLTRQVQSMEQVAAMKAALEGGIFWRCEGELLKMKVQTRLNQYKEKETHLGSSN